MGNIGIIVLLLRGVVFAAQQPPASLQPNSLPVSPRRLDAQSQAPPERDRSNTDTYPDYVLGPGDQITVSVVDGEEFNGKPLQIDMSGYVRLPVVGRIRMSGLTVPQVETELANRLKTYLLKPDVSVSIVEFRSQPVSVIGAVKNPGVQQVQGRKKLIEMLSVAGGLDTTAGPMLKITRLLEWGRIPLATATVDPTGRFSLAEVSLKSLIEAKKPEENILVKPYDVISVPRAEMVYVIGQVTRAGGFVLNDRETLTALQALSLAGGLERTARPQHARILRSSAGEESRSEIPVNLKKILDGRTPDIPMQPDDILFVPTNVPQKAALRALEAAVQAGTGIVIWRR
jgi:polysaccharide export outer membrane protein